MIETTKYGTIIATGNGIEVFRLATLASALRLEIKCPERLLSEAKSKTAYVTEANDG